MYRAHAKRAPILLRTASFHSGHVVMRLLLFYPQTFLHFSFLADTILPIQPYNWVLSKPS